jgi:regulator of protease activity HflC (stomatin/prohibitin superfamily)
MKKIFYLAMIALCFAATVTSCTVVDNSEIGLKYKKFAVSDQGKLEAYTVTGYVWYNPFTTAVYTYPTYVQRINYAPFTVNTKDGSIFTMDPVLAYQLNRDRAVDVFTKYRKSLEEIQNGYMSTCVYDAYRITANRYTADELVSNRAKFEGEVRQMLDKSLGDEGFIVTEFTSQITPPETLQHTIEAKNKAVQDALRVENEIKATEASARKKVIEAEGAAEALRVQADGEAYYNRTVAASLTPTLVQQYAIEKWDGDLPNVTGGNSIPMIDLK